MKQLRLKKAYGGKSEGDIYECDDLRAVWLEENGFVQGDPGESEKDARTPRRRRSRREWVGEDD